MKEKLNTPNPKVFYVLIVTVFIIVTSISVSAYKKNNPTNKTEARTGNESIILVDNKLRGIYDGIDDDGMFSWEKVLNSMNREGLDYEDLEINLETDPNSFTSEVGINAIMTIMESMADPNSKTDLDKLIREITGATEDVLTYKNKFNTNQIFQTDSSHQSVRNYLNNLFIISERESLKVMGRNFSTEEEFVAELAVMYKNLAIQLSSMAVPDVFVNTHTEYINSMDAVSFYSQIVLNEESDPILAYAAIPKMDEKMELMIKLYTQITYYPINNGIIFEEDDYVYDYYN